MPSAIQKTYSRRFGLTVTVLFCSRGISPPSTLLIKSAYRMYCDTIIAEMLPQSIETLPIVGITSRNILVSGPGIKSSHRRRPTPHSSLERDQALPAGRQDVPGFPLCSPPYSFEFELGLCRRGHLISLVLLAVAVTVSLDKGCYIISSGLP